MKALVHTGPLAFEMQDVAVPRPQAGEVLVKVHSVGICGSDVHGMTGKTGRRIPPIIMGHEASGIVVEMGSDVSEAGIEKGDRVTFDSTVYCNHCSYCLQGLVNLCENRQVLGVSCGDYRRHGAMAEYVVVPEHIICKLPEAMSLEHAAMIEPVSIAVHAVNRAAPRIGSSALVIGCGIIGQFTVQAARLAGCGTVVAVDLDQGRLDMAKRLGADLIVNSADADWKDIARKAAGRDGFDYVFEAVGLEVTVQAALDLVRRGGRTVLIGNVSPSIQVPLQRIVTGEIDVLGSCASAGEYATCVELVSRGQIRVAELISRTAPLSDGEHWFKELHGPRSDGGKEPLFKIILQP